MLILSLRTCPHRPRSIHTHKPALQCCGGGPQGPTTPAVKSDLVLLGEGAREAGDGLGSSMGPFPYHLVHIPIASASHRPLPPASASLPADVRATHTRRHLTPPLACEQVRPGQPSTLEPLAAARLLGQGAPCPLASPPCAPYHTPAARRTRPTLSCDGGRPSHGRATLLLSGRPEAYDKFRWRAGSGRGSLAAVLCVVGPQGRQIAPRLAHALPHPPTIPDRSCLGSLLVPPSGYPGASWAGVPRRGVSCVRVCSCVR